MKNIVFEKSKKFALRIIRMYKYLCGEKKEYVLSKQLLRSGTSMGANIAEANKKYFLHIVLQTKIFFKRFHITIHNQ